MSDAIDRYLAEHHPIDAIEVAEHLAELFADIERTKFIAEVILHSPHGSLAAAQMADDMWQIARRQVSPDLPTEETP